MGGEVLVVDWRDRLQFWAPILRTSWLLGFLKSDEGRYRSVCLRPFNLVAISLLSVSAQYRSAFSLQLVNKSSLQSLVQSISARITECMGGCPERKSRGAQRLTGTEARPFAAAAPRLDSAAARTRRSQKDQRLAAPTEAYQSVFARYSRVNLPSSLRAFSPSCDCLPSFKQRSRHCIGCQRPLPHLPRRPCQSLSQLVARSRGASRFPRLPREQPRTHLRLEHRSISTQNHAFGGSVA